MLAYNIQAFREDPACDNVFYHGPGHSLGPLKKARGWNEDLTAAGVKAKRPAFEGLLPVILCCPGSVPVIRLVYKLDLMDRNQ